MADLLTSSYHAIGSYGAMYGCISYKYTNYDTYTRIYIYWLGEGLKTTASDAASYYELQTSATIKGEVLIGSTSKKSWSSTASSTRSGNATYSSYIWFKAGGSDSNYVDITRTTAAQTVTIKVTYTVSGYSSKTGTTTITVPAKETCTITYNSNGGSGNMANTTYTYASSGTTTLRKNTFTKTDYDFLGWNLDGSQTAKYADEQNWNLNNKGNYTLYAVWKKDIVISYDANDGIGTAPATQSATVYNNTTSQSFKIATNTFTRTNYKFVSWNTKEDGSGTTYQPNDSINFSKSTILYAIWESTFVPPELTISSIRDSNNTGIATINLNWTKGSIGGTSINTTYYKIQYKKYNVSTWSGDTEYTSTTETSYSETLNGLDDVQYDIKVSIYSEGYSNTVVSKTDFISAAFYVIDITADGKGIGLLTSAPTIGINVSSAIKNLGALGLSATGSGGIAIGARSGTNTISSAGSGSIASGFAQGGSIEATTKGAFAGGLADGNNKITASGTGSFAFGQSNSTAALTASGNGSITMGLGCTSSGDFSLTHNMYTTATGRAQTVLGTWNIIDSATTSTHPTGISNLAQFKKYAFIIGNGTSDSARSNAFAITWDGTIEMNNVPMADYIVEEGPISSPAWWKYYRKWNSGLFELDGYYSGAPTTGSHYSNIVTDNTGTVKLYGYRSENYSFPSECVPIDTGYTVLASWTIGSGFAFDCGTVGTQTTQKFSIYAIGSHGNQTSIAVRIYVRGRWK